MRVHLDHILIFAEIYEGFISAFIQDLRPPVNQEGGCSKTVWLLFASKLVSTAADDCLCAVTHNALITFIESSLL